MALTQRAGRSRHRLILLVLTAATFLTLDFRDFGPLDSAQSAVRDLLDPVASLASTVFSPVSDVWNGLFDYDDLEAENERLRQERDDLLGAQLTSQADLQAFEALRAAVDIDYAGDIESVAAAVTRGGVGNFDDDVITIDKGTRDGIEDGMAVVTGAGLVGRIEDADATTSRVLLLSDPSLVVGVRLVGIDEVGLAHARGGSSETLLIDQGLGWPEGGDSARLPEIGSAVVTDSTSRYPAGVPVGEVTAVDSPDGLTMIVDVKLLNELEDLTYVSVLLQTGADTLPLEDVVPRTTLPLEPEPEPEQEAEEGE
jgi:rod shape-determining protein MreC